MRLTCLNMVYEMAKTDKRVFFIGSDLGFGTLQQFREEIPDRFFMEGINEAHAVGMAAGLALEGKIVYVNTIATFLTRRCFEQIVLDLCLHNVNVRLIGNGGGVVYAPLGSTHLAFEDLAILRALPNMTIVAPADAAEMRRFMPQTLEYAGPIYIRLAKGFDPIVSKEEIPFRIGQGLVIKPGRDILVLTTGITLRLAIAAAEILEREGIETAILHLPTLKPIDKERILNMAEIVKAVITIEEHTIIGGLGSAVAELLAEADFDQPKRYRRIGLPDTFPDKLGYGSQDSLMYRHNITTENLVETARSLLETVKRTTV